MSHIHLKDVLTLISQEVEVIDKTLDNFLVSDFHTKSYIFTGSPSKPINRLNAYSSPMLAEPVNDGIIGFVSSKLGKPIFFYGIQESTPPTPLRGYMENSATKASIHVKGKPTQNTCYQRLTAAKELVHIILGNQRNSTNSLDKIEENITMMLAGDGFSTDVLTHDYISEHTAYLMAMRLLLPNHDEFYTKAELLLNGGSSYKDIAEIYKVPEQHLRAYVKIKREDNF